MELAATALDLLKPFLEQDDSQFPSVLFFHETLDLRQCKEHFGCRNIMLQTWNNIFLNH